MNELKETESKDSISSSGYLVDGFEGVNDGFTQMTTVATRNSHVLTRAKRHGRWYLLKSLAPDVANKTVYQEMLNKEFDIAIRLQHHGIVQTVNIEDVPLLGRSIVMEWVDGMTLTQWLEKNPTRRERLKVLDQLLSAVAYLHDLGIVHRDLKPSNILVTAMGHHVKLIDFSLADTEAHAILKQPGGTAGYISPEQSTKAVPDLRNDIYSLGVIIQNLGLKGLYSRIADRCLLPADRRYQSIDDLRDALKSRNAHSLWMGMGLILVLVIILMSVILALRQQRSTAITEKSLDDSTSVEPATVIGSDSAIEETDLQSLDVVVMPVIQSARVMDSINSKFQPSVENMLKRDDHLKDAISNGANDLTFVLYRYVTKNKQDTLSDVKYLRLDYEDMRSVGQAEIDRYINEIHNQYSDKELNYIRKVLNSQCDSYISDIKDLVKSRE